MNEENADRVRNTRAGLVESIARAARALLVLDDGLPTDLRVAALTMPAERLFWTLTQLDHGLDLDTCQALVRASRLSQESHPASTHRAGDIMSATAWLHQRWATLPDVAELIAWLTWPDLHPAPLAPVWSRFTPDGAFETRLALPVTTAAPDPPASTTVHWLNTPPIIGPPPGSDSARLDPRFLGWLRDTWPWP